MGPFFAVALRIQQAICYFVSSMPNLKFVPVLVAVCAAPVWCQTPEPVKEKHGLPVRATPADYQVVALAGKVSIAAEFTGHAIPNAQEPLQSEDYVAVEVALFGPAGERLVITASDFSLRLNGKKEALPSQPFGLVARQIKDPEWVPEEGGSSGPRSKTAFSGSAGGASAGSGRQPGDPPPPPPKPPIELLRNWQQRVARAALAEGDRALPQAGLLFFPYRGKTESIKSIELVYAGPAGNAVLKLR